MRLTIVLGMGALGVGLWGCTEREVSAADRRLAAEAEAKVTPRVVDSALPIAQLLTRFRQGLEEPKSLQGGLATREGLVRGFVRALETRDSAALGRMVMRKDEFAWLYYPASPQSRPPYELPPGLMWFQMQGLSQKGASLLLSERAGAPLGYLGHDCASTRTEGKNRLFGHCVLRRVIASGDTVRERLFGLIIERGGMYKFVSYANKLD